MHELHTSIDIDAPPEVVWRVLTDFASYPEWNDYTRIEGEAVEGTTLRVSPGPEAGRSPTFTPEVRRTVPNRELRWLGHLFVRGLFDGEHRFEIDPLDDGGTRFVQSEQFSGVLVRPILWLVGGDTEANFEGVNRALKARAESLAADGDDTADDEPTQAAA
ncbi:SRPBCC domain-containing protein [Halorarius litoreus]|uniref:SRPBCC domain-containing protein n=1 Tax=Halorarius litoreus TaxID=2962676 RepID=UPI0020CC59E3|nr:SRPBCC domain-containing protein [Halorarius litoreus]